MNKNQEHIDTIKAFLDDAENVETKELEQILDRVVAIVTKSTRVECWILVVDGVPQEDDCSDIDAAYGLNLNRMDDVFKDLWASMHDCVLENTFPPGHLRVDFVARNFIHQEGQQSFPETGQWDFLPYWEHDIEMVGFERLDDDAGGANV